MFHTSSMTSQGSVEYWSITILEWILVQSTWRYNVHMYKQYTVINKAFHIQHHEGVHIYIQDTNIADGVDGEEIPRDTLVFLCRL